MAAREALEHDDSIARPLEKTDGLLDHHVILHGQHASTRAATEDRAARHGDRLIAPFDDEVHIGRETGAQAVYFLIESQAHLGTARTRVDLRRDVVEGCGKRRGATRNEDVGLQAVTNLGQVPLVDIGFDLDIRERCNLVDDRLRTDHLTPINRAREHHAAYGRDDAVIPQS